MNFVFILSQADEGAAKDNVAYFLWDFCDEFNHNKRVNKEFLYHLSKVHLSFFPTGNLLRILSQ